MLFSFPSALLFAAVASATPFLQIKPVTPPPAFIHYGDAIYGTQSSKLRSALTCPNGTPTANSQPVLLVHGVDSTGRESWNQGYIPALTAQGYTPCYLDLPHRGTGDMQIYSAYVAYNLHHLSWLAGGNAVAILGHGQASSIIQWAMQFYPSTHRVTRAFIGLSPNLAGVSRPERPGDCEVAQFVDEQRCRPCAWQNRIGSKYYEALHYRYSVAQVPTTLLWSMSDEVIQPAAENARLAGATSIAVQHLCPNRTVTHSGMLVDTTVFNLVRDALRHGGFGSIERSRPHAFHLCAADPDSHMQRPVMKSWWPRNQVMLEDCIPTTALRVAQEPEIVAYAQLRNQ